MIITIIVGIIAVLFGWLAKFKNVRFGLWISFAFIFLFLALRYNFGNDYKEYLDRFLEINRYSSINFFDKTFNFEPGWIALCRLFRPVGFFGMTAVLAMLNCFIYYRFIKNYVPVRYYWLAIFLYVFSSGFMLTHASAMRQSLTINIFLFSLPYIYNKKALRYLLCISLAMLFHTAAIILAPIYLLGVFNWKINKVTATAIYSVFILLFIYGKAFMPIINQVVSDKFKRYEAYLQSGASELTTGLGVLFLSIILILALYYAQFQNKEYTLLFKLFILGMMFIPLSFMLIMLGRIEMYFAPIGITILPIIVSDIKNRLTRVTLVVFIICFTLYGFIQFYKSPIWHDAFITYQTIFSAPEFY